MIARFVFTSSLLFFDNFCLGSLPDPTAHSTENISSSSSSMSTSVYWSCFMENAYTISTTQSQTLFFSSESTDAESSYRASATIASNAFSSTLWTTSNIPSFFSGTPNSTSRNTTPISTTCQPSAPAATLPGISTNCCQYHVIVESDTCDSVDLQYGLSLGELIALNLDLHEDCLNLEVGVAYCVQLQPSSTSSLLFASTTLGSSSVFSTLFIKPSTIPGGISISTESFTDSSSKYILTPTLSAKVSDQSSSLIETSRTSSAPSSSCTQISTHGASQKSSSTLSGNGSSTSNSVPSSLPTPSGKGTSSSLSSTTLGTASVPTTYSNPISDVSSSASGLLNISPNFSASAPSSVTAGGFSLHFSTATSSTISDTFDTSHSSSLSASPVIVTSYANIRSIAFSPASTSMSSMLHTLGFESSIAASSSMESQNLPLSTIPGSVWSTTTHNQLSWLRSSSSGFSSATATADTNFFISNPSSTIIYWPWLSSISGTRSSTLNPSPSSPTSLSLSGISINSGVMSSSSGMSSSLAISSKNTYTSSISNTIVSWSTTVSLSTGTALSALTSSSSSTLSPLFRGSSSSIRASISPSIGISRSASLTSRSSQSSLFIGASSSSNGSVSASGVAGSLSISTNVSGSLLSSVAFSAAVFTSTKSAYGGSGAFSTSITNDIFKLPSSTGVYSRAVSSRSTGSPFGAPEAGSTVRSVASSSLLAGVLSSSGKSSSSARSPSSVPSTYGASQSSSANSQIKTRSSNPPGIISSLSETDLKTMASTLAPSVPSLAPNISAYIAFMNTNASYNLTRKQKRTPELLFLKLNTDGTVSTTTSCLSADVFILTSDHRVAAAGLYAFVSLANASTGLSDFTFGPNNPRDIEDFFTAPGDILTWSNELFVTGKATFGFPGLGSGLVVVSFNGLLPQGYFAPVLFLLNTNSPGALHAGCSSSSLTSSVVSPRSSSSVGVFETIDTGISSAPTIPSMKSGAPKTSFRNGASSISADQFIISTVYTTIVYTITSCHSTVTNCPARIGSVTTEIISLYTTVCPVTPPATPTATTYLPPSPQEGTSTIYTTVVYTITSCHSTVTNCPVGHITTDIISVSTTICPAKPSAAPTEPAYVIGILVTFVVDIIVELDIYKESTETIFITETILIDTADLYNQATQGQPCYACQLTSMGFMWPSSDITVTRTLCRSSPPGAQPPYHPLIIQTCSTCSQLALSSNLRNLLLQTASGISWPPKQELQVPSSTIEVKNMQSLNSNSETIRITSSPVLTNRSQYIFTTSTPESSSGKMASPQNQTGGVGIGRCSVAFVLFAMLGVLLVL